jgi:hypothetical protein
MKSALESSYILFFFFWCLWLPQALPSLDFKFILGQAKGYTISTNGWRIWEFGIEWKLALGTKLSADIYLTLSVSLIPLSFCRSFMESKEIFCKCLQEQQTVWHKSKSLHFFSMHKAFILVISIMWVLDEVKLFYMASILG